ncbi:MAG: hypothetical protein ACKOTF_02725 [Opitutaceae bacterium]
MGAARTQVDWFAVQMDCDLRRAQRELGARIVREVKPREVAA